MDLQFASELITRHHDDNMGLTRKSAFEERDRI
jgi:hypothetical protein